MAGDAATLVYDIDSSQAVGAAKALALMERAAAEVATSTAKMEKQTLKANGTFVSFSDLAKKNAKDIRSLADDFNPVLAAQLKMAEQEKRLAQAVQLGVVSAEDKADALARLRAQYDVSANAAVKFGAATDNARHHVMNLGYQINDIGMMMALGQNPFALMMQQGPQVAQIFATMNAEGQKIGPTIAGAFRAMLNPTTLVTLAVIGGAAALTQWAFSGRDAATANDGFVDSLSGLAESANSYAMALQTANQNAFALTAEFGAQAESLQRLYDLNVQLENIKLGQAVRDAANQANAAYGDLGDRLARINDLINYAAQNEYVRADALSQARLEMAALNDEYGLSLGQATKLNDALMDMAKASTIEEQAIAAEEFGVQLLAAHRAGATIPPELIRIASEAGVAAVAIREIAAASREAAAAWIDVNTGSFISDYENPNPAPGMDTGTPIMSYRPNRTLTPAPRRGGGGGGGRGGGAGGGAGGGKSEAEIMQEEMQKRYEVLQEGFRSEFELSASQYTKDLETLKFALDQKLVTQQEYETQKAMLHTNAWGSEYEQSMLQYQLDQEALASALEQKLITEQEYLNRRRQLNWDMVAAVGQDTGNVWAQELGNFAQHLGQMNEMAGGGYEKLLKAQKTFAAASALINAYKGASDVLAQPGLPWYVKLAAASKVLAAGIGFVSAIKSGGGGGGKSSGGSSSASVPVEKKEPMRVVTINLQGGTTRDREFAEQLIQDIYQQSKDGRVIIARDR